MPDVIQSSKFRLDVGGTEVDVTSVDGIGVTFGDVPMATSKTQRTNETRAGHASWSQISISRPYAKDGSNGSIFEDWLKEVFNNPNSDEALKSVVVALVDHEDADLHTWSFERCWVSAWNLSGFQAGDGGLLTESVTLTVNEWQELQPT